MFLLASHLKKTSVAGVASGRLVFQEYIGVGGALVGFGGLYSPAWYVVGPLQVESTKLR
jgi:hypothetical protein